MTERVAGFPDLRQEKGGDRRSLDQDRLEVATLGTRCFCAVPLPDGLRRELALWQGQLASIADGTKWVEPPNLHLTIAFFGDLSRDQIEMLTDGISRELAGLSAGCAHVDGAGAFPSVARARVLWVGVSDGDLPRELSLAACRGAGAAGVSVDQRQFRPHITIGRVREPRPNEELRQRLVDHARTRWGVLPLDRMVLYASELRPNGPTYAEIASWRLA